MVDLKELFPEFSWWVVCIDSGAGWRADFKHSFMRQHVIARIFCTLEGSLGPWAIQQFTVIDADTTSIEPWNLELHGTLDGKMNNHGIAFAETGKVYRKKDLDELRMDYAIAALAGLKQ